MSYDPEAPSLRPTDITPALQAIGLGRLVTPIHPDLETHVGSVAARLRTKVELGVAVSESWDPAAGAALHAEIREFVDDFTYPADLDAPRETDFLKVLEHLYRAGRENVTEMTSLLADYRGDARRILSSPRRLEFRPTPVWPADVLTDPSINRRVFWVVYGVMAPLLDRLISGQRRPVD